MKALSFLLRNCLRFATLKGLGSLFVFIGKIFCAGLTTFLAYLLIISVDP
jgi:hypothetical protein